MSVPICLCVANVRTLLQPPIIPLVVSLSNHSSGVTIPLIPFDKLRMSGIRSQGGYPVVRMLPTTQEEAERHA